LKQTPLVSSLERTRRTALLMLFAGLLTACGSSVSRRLQSPLPPLNAEDEALQLKFRGLEGGQLRVDSLFDVHGLNIFDEHGVVFFRHANLTPPNGRFRGSYGADFGVPKSLRVEWRDKIEMEPDGWRIRGLPAYAYYGGTVLGDYTIPVASRIPDAILEERRRNGGGFRLKIRIHPDGPLIGWDLERGPGTAPDGSKFHHAGGDFQEAYIYNGKVLRKGWYIHPKTGERIETDY